MHGANMKSDESMFTFPVITDSECISRLNATIINVYYTRAPCFTTPFALCVFDFTLHYQYTSHINLRPFCF